MPIIQMSDIVNDPYITAPEGYVITRNYGSWVAGIWTVAPTTLQGYGVIRPAKEEELEMVPAGDRVKGLMCFYSSTPIFISGTTAQNDGNAHTSDQIAWNGQNWRVVAVGNWTDFGYWKAIARRMSGE
jgi:hypothetical protein